MSRKLKINKGDVFNRLTIIKEIIKKGEPRIFLCRCNPKYGGCGKKIKVILSALRNNTTKSCGCLNIEKIIERNTTHGLRYKPTYPVYINMMGRCTNKNHPSYYNYGGKKKNPVTVCNRWKKGYRNTWSGLINFDKDMGPTWFKGGELERIDNTKGYSPNNCKWATEKQQARNRSTNISIKINRKRYCLMEAMKKFGKIEYRAALWRINNGWNPIDAIFIPTKSMSTLLTDVRVEKI